MNDTERLLDLRKKLTSIRDNRARLVGARLELLKQLSKFNCTSLEEGIAARDKLKRSIEKGTAIQKQKEEEFQAEFGKHFGGVR